ncbi:MAG: hypothetical protein H0W99_10445 [Acidobacteria bacterium]|nr:hypothetical protein [Acidobacteriota bacterium]
MIATYVARQLLPVAPTEQAMSIFSYHEADDLSLACRRMATVDGSDGYLKTASGILPEAASGSRVIARV